MFKFFLISDASDTTDFNCENEELNSFLKQKALLNQQRMLGATTLLIDDDSPSFIIGYYTLCPCHVESSVLPKKFGGNLPREIPAIKLARLAVDKEVQGQCFGEILLAHALRCSYQQSLAWRSGYVVLIDVKPSAKGFYQKYGMKMIKDEDDEVLMGMRTKDIPKHFPVSS